MKPPYWVVKRKPDFEGDHVYLGVYAGTTPDPWRKTQKEALKFEVFHEALVEALKCKLTQDDDARAVKVVRK